MMIQQYSKEAHKKTIQSGMTLDYEFRKKMLLTFKEMLNNNKENIAEALAADFEKPYFESYATEIVMIFDELRYMLKHLNTMMQPKKVPTSLLHFYSKSQIVPEPYGNVLVIAPWNYPFSLSLIPMIGAIAAGNTVVLKPSEHAPNSASLMKDMIEEYFSSDYISVVQGGSEVTQKLIKDDFDYIFFTGSTAVGREIMKTASETLTPVTLELGGKSPTIVTEDADLVKAAVRIAWGKIVNAGQTCIAPDYVMVHESVKNQFVLLLQMALQKFYGKDVLNNPDYPSMINDKHFNRVKELIENQELLYGGAVNQKTRKIEPTLIDEPPVDSDVMKEEIFGPVLPIIPYSTLAEVYEFIQSRDKPLALYLFTEDKTVKKEVVKHLSFGGGIINDTLIHFTNQHLPFGGVGASGMGSYHGKHSFMTFSHYKGVTEKTTLFDIPLRYPPYTDWKNKIINFIAR